MKGLYKIYNSISARANYLVNRFMLRRAKAEFKTFPVIHGRLIIKNNGYCKIGENVTFKSSFSSNYVGLSKKCSVFIDTNASLIIGSNAGFSGISIYCSRAITIGNYVNCGGNVSIWDTDFHPLDFEDRRMHRIDKIASSPVTVGDDVFIGANTIVLKGVAIGNRSVIGAGSIVTKQIPADEIWAGNPARFIKKIAK